MTLATNSPPMSATRRAALIAGVAYIATFIFSIPVKFGLWTDVLDDRDFILGSGNAGGVPTGALFEVLTALGGVVTAVALYSVAKRYSYRAALGFVTARLLEAAMIFVGVISIMTVYVLREDVAGTSAADASALWSIGQALVSMHDLTFLLGPGLIAALNALLIGSVMYRSQLVPRWIPRLGLIGAPLLLASNTAVLFGVWDQVSSPAMALTMPVAVWEVSFGIYMAFKGFRSTAVNGSARATGASVQTAPAFA